MQLKNFAMMFRVEAKIKEEGQANAFYKQRIESRQVHFDALY